MEEIAKHCFGRITAQTKRPLFVGIAGDSGSGKSYLVALLEGHFKQAGLAYSLINHDEFLISRKDREPMRSTYYENGKKILDISPNRLATAHIVGRINACRI